MTDGLPMVLIALMAVFAVAACVFVLVLQHYLRIILNLFLNVQIKGEPNPAIAIDGRPVAFASADGTPLAGQFMPARSGEGGRRPTVIFCHEFGNDRLSAAEYADFLRDEGFHVFAFDFRNHGQSAVKPNYTPRHWASEFELNDLLGAFDAVAAMPEADSENIGLLGISRGGVTAICAAALRPTRFVVSDGAFSTHQVMEDYMRKWVSIYGKTPTLYRYYPMGLYRTLRRLAIRLSHFRLGYRFLDLADALRAVTAPILFIHGERDTYIKADHARWLHRLYGGPKQLYIAPKARHNEAVRLHPVEYRRRVVEFAAVHTEAAPQPQPSETL